VSHLGGGGFTDSTSSTTSAAGSHLKLRYDLGDLLAGSRASGFLSGEPSTTADADPALATGEEGAGRPASLLLDCTIFRDLAVLFVAWLILCRLHAIFFLNGISMFVRVTTRLQHHNIKFDKIREKYN
jgi:hypothetical protein